MEVYNGEPSGSCLNQEDLVASEVQIAIYQELLLKVKGLQSNDPERKVIDTIIKNILELIYLS